MAKKQLAACALAVFLRHALSRLCLALVGAYATMFAVFPESQEIAHLEEDMTLSPDQIREKFIQAQEPAVVQWYVDRVMEEVHAHPDDAHVTLRFDVPEEDERPEFLEHLLKLACPQLKSAVRPLGRTEVFHLPESERKGFKKKIVAYVVWVR